MGLFPEFFVLLGIEIFLAMSLLSALLDGDVPSSLQYLFQGAAVVGLGLLYMSQSFINSGILGRDPTDVTRFWVSVVYLTAAVSNVVGLNVYLAAVRWKMGLASAFIGTVTVPTLMVSAIFVSSFLGTGGEVSFTPASIMMLAVAALVIGLSMFGFLRQASRHLGLHGRGASPTGLPTVSAVAGGSMSKPPGVPGMGLPLPLPSKQGEDWEESPTKEKGEG